MKADVCLSERNCSGENARNMHVSRMVL